MIGGTGIDDALVDGGYVPVRALADEPAAVMQGFSPDVSWRDLAEATFAVRTGLPWIATNPDLTFPAPGGIAPGNGALVRLVAETVGRGPDAVAGKPEPPLLREAIRRTRAGRPLMVGDRLDTDIAAGARIGIPSLLVFTGVTTLAELLAAVPEERPEYLGADLRVLLRALSGGPSARPIGSPAGGRARRSPMTRSRSPSAATRGTRCARLPPWRGRAPTRAGPCGSTTPSRSWHRRWADAAGSVRTGTVGAAAGTTLSQGQTKE